MMRKITHSQELNLQEKNTKNLKSAMILSLTFKLNPVHYYRCKGIATRDFVSLNLQNSTFTYDPHTVYCTVYVYGPQNSVITLFASNLHICMYCKCSKAAEKKN
jgi:hypothetical protein